MAAPPQETPIVVLQSIGGWLENTMVWLYDQVTSLGPDIQSHVVCERRVNPDQFQVPRIHCLTAQFPLRSKWDRTLRKTGLRGGLSIKNKIARQSGASILHSHFGNYGWGDMETAREVGLKHVVTFYGVDVNKFPSQDQRWLSRYRDLFISADCFLCEGPFMAESLVKMGCPREKIVVHHLGVRVSAIRYQPRRLERRRPLRILMCASFVEKKGLPYAIEALARLKSDIDFEATLIGGSNGTPLHEAEKRKILEAIDRHHLSDKIRMLGFLPYERVIEEAYTHDIFLSPSVTGSDGDTEGGAPVTIALMAATGMPVVSTTHCDVPEIVEHGVSALLAPERDASALAEHLRWFHENAEERESFGAASRSRMQREFDCERQGQKLATIYREVNDGLHANQSAAMAVETH